MKQWVAVLTYKGREIQVLNGATTGDCQDYRIWPPLNQCTYPNVADAVAAIDREAAR